VLRSPSGTQERAPVKLDIETSDIVVGVLAALGVVVLIIVFVWVFKDRMLDK
jgi:hypothetical protein